jgi:hypothetical protein
MADPEIPEVRAELQREDARDAGRGGPSYGEQRVRWLMLLIFAVVVLAVIVFAYLR